MGCFWSSEPESSDRHNYNRSRSAGDLLYRDNYTYTVQHTHTTQRRAQSIPRPRVVTEDRRQPLYGEFKCMSCGRTWNSRLCWENNFQICSRCKKPVYPHSQRQLLPSDSVESKENKEHKKELCQMCQQLGHYCGNFGKRRDCKRKF